MTLSTLQLGVGSLFTERPTTDWPFLKEKGSDWHGKCG